MLLLADVLAVIAYRTHSFPRTYKERKEHCCCVSRIAIGSHPPFKLMILAVIF